MRPNRHDDILISAPKFVLTDETDNETLQQHLGDGVFQWLCSCAVYPELQWELTLRLGTLTELPIRTFNEQNLRKLASLPWFQHGQIPPEVRARLIAALPHTLETQVRTTLSDYLVTSKATLPAKSYAADTYDLELALHQWKLNPDPARRNELLDVLESLPNSMGLENPAIVHQLQWPKLRSLQKRLFQHGSHLFPLSSSGKFGIAIVAGIVGGLVFGLLIPFLFPNPKEIELNPKEIEFTFIPAHAFRHGRTLPIQSIVVHSTDGREANDIVTLTGPKVSCHWYVTRSGKIYHFVDDADTAFHAGLVFQSKFSNSASLGIDLEHFDPDPDPIYGKHRPDGEDWPDVQVTALSHLCAFLIQKHHLSTAILSDTIKSHVAIAKPLGRKQDPFHFPFPKLFDLITATLHDPWTAVQVKRINVIPQHDGTDSREYTIPH